MKKCSFPYKQCGCFTPCEACVDNNSSKQKETESVCNDKTECIEGAKEFEF